jgi:hypothetical protein
VPKRRIAAIKELAREHPLPPLVLVLGVLLAAVMAKFDHPGWAAAGMLAFYPLYLGVLALGRTEPRVHARIGVGR